MQGMQSSIPGEGTQIPRTVEKLRPPAAATEPTCHTTESVHHNERSLMQSYK